jgi:hypothetical protein
MGGRGNLVIKALCYEPEGRGFETPDINTYVQTSTFSIMTTNLWIVCTGCPLTLETYAGRHGKQNYQYTAF